MNLCHVCIKAKAVMYDKGTPVCQDCYHKRYTKRKFTNQNASEKEFTLKDLKRVWEKNY